MGLRHPALTRTAPPTLNTTTCAVAVQTSEYPSLSKAASYLFPRGRGKIEMGVPLYFEELVRPEPVEVCARSP